MKIFGREPVYILGFLAAAIQALSAFGLEVSQETQTAVNTAAAAVVAVTSAIVLKNGALGAALLNLAQAGMALFVGLGLDWSADDQAKWMALVSAGIALYLHEKVTAPIAAVPLEQKSPVTSKYGQTA